MTENDEKPGLVTGSLLSRGLRRSIEVSWLMVKIYVPVSLLTIVLKQLGIIDSSGDLYRKLLRVGLPKETAR